MKLKSGHPLFDNAVDSLEHGIRMYRDATYPNAHKYAVLAVYQAIELFLKDALWRVDPLLIYSDMVTPIREDGHTVGYKEAAMRLSKQGIQVDPAALAAIKKLQKRRNRIEHFEYQEAGKDKYDMAAALKVLWDFVPKYLRTEGLATFVEADLCVELQQHIFDYDRLVAEAQKRMLDEKGIEDVKPGDLPETTVVECPECEQRLLVISGRDGKDYCFFCQRTVPMGQCSLCGEYCSASLLVDTSNCPVCLANRGD